MGYLMGIPTKDFTECFEQWKKCWKNCVRSHGAYFQGDWGVIVLCTMFLVFCIFFHKCLYFSVCDWILSGRTSIYGGTQKTGNSFILNIYPYMFKLQSPSKYSPFDAIHLSRRLSHCSEQFLNSSILMPLSASAVFCFASSTAAQRFPLRKPLVYCVASVVQSRHWEI